MGLDSVAILQWIEGMGLPSSVAMIPIQAAENNVRAEFYLSQQKECMSIIKGCNIVRSSLLTMHARGISIHQNS